MADIKTIIFDWAGVFCSPGELFTLPALLERTGLNAAEMEARVKPMQDKYYRGEITSETFWRHVFETFKIDPLPLSDLNVAYFGSSTPYPDVLAIPEKLKAHYTVALLSNLTEEMMDHIVPTHDLAPKFHAMFFSNRTGRFKPEPESFLQVLGELKAEPATTLFIDDSQKNLGAAATLGMQTLLCNTPEQLMTDLKKLKLL